MNQFHFFSENIILNFLCFYGLFHWTCSGKPRATWPKKDFIKSKPHPLISRSMGGGSTMDVAWRNRSFNFPGIWHLCQFQRKGFDLLSLPGVMEGLGNLISTHKELEIWTIASISCDMQKPCWTMSSWQIGSSANVWSTVFYQFLLYWMQIICCIF